MSTLVFRGDYRCKSSFNIIDRDNCTGLGLNCEGYFILKVHQSVT